MNSSYSTIPELFFTQAEKYKDETCLSSRIQPGAPYTDITWTGLKKQVEAIAVYLILRGIKKGDRVAICAGNRPEWWAADLAILSIGAINVSIFSRTSASALAYILDHCQASFCFVDYPNLEKLNSVRKKLKALKNVVVMDPVVTSEKTTVTLPDAIREAAKSAKKTDLVKQNKLLKGSDTASIVYTQSITGNPRGVVLSHSNFLSDVSQIMSALGESVHERHVFLSILPLANLFERTLGFYLPVACGSRVAFSEGESSRLLTNIREIRPTFMVGVPVLYERLHAGVLSMIPDMFFPKKAVMKMALQIALVNVPYVCSNNPRRGFFARQYNLFDKHVYKSLKTEVGMDRLECAVSCGAPLSVSDAEFFLGLGIPVLDSYGLTEASSVTHMAVPGSIRPGTVGKALPDTEVLITDEGECLVRGPQVMKGYYRDRNTTLQLLTKDGFLRTGDMGIVDADGYLTITGRIKDIIITAGGKNIAPATIENTLRESLYIKNAAIIGDRRKFLTALVLPDMDNLRRWAKSSNLHFKSDQELLALESVQRLIRAEIDDATKHLARIEQIKFFRIITDPWSEETGEITSTGRIHRAYVGRKYATIIEEMYS